MRTCQKASRLFLLDYKETFPTDLPPGLPPVQMGHEFKIKLEDDTLPIHRPIYKLSPLELEEARKANPVYARVWIHQAIDIPVWSPSAVCTKEGWRSSVLYRLPLVEQGDHQE